MNTTQACPLLELNDGSRIPQVGLGMARVDQGAAKAILSHAFNAGYRHVDTASIYGNEVQVGEAIRGGGESIFVTTKYFNPGEGHGYADAIRAFGDSLDKLGLRHIDLYLIHWPVEAGEGFTASWRALVDLRDGERLRSIGVSNFSASRLRQLADRSQAVPAINQVELHPYFQQPVLRAAHQELGVVTAAWAPLARGRILDDPVLASIAVSHGKSIAQVVIRWHVQLGTVVIPKSANPARIAENFDVLDFELREDEMNAIARLDRGERIGRDPDTYRFPTDYRPESWS